MNNSLFFSTSPFEILNSFVDSIAILDQKGKIIYANQTWKQYSVKKDSNLENYIHIAKLIEGGAHYYEDAKEGVRKVIQQEAPSFEMVYPYNTETDQKWFSMRCIPLINKPEFIKISHRDISKQKLAEIEVYRYNNLLEESQKVAQVGGWELDIVKNHLYWTAETYRIHDTSPEEFNPTVDAGVGYFLPESKKIISDALEKAWGEGIGYDLYLETYTTKGRKIDVRTTCQVTMENGKPIKLFGIFQDVTHHRIREKKLIESLKEVSDYKYALNQSSIVAITNKKGIITYANENFSQISGYSHDELIGQNHRLINSGYHSKDFWVEMWKTIGSGNVWRGEIKNKTKEGRFYWVDTFIIPFKDDKGVIQQYIAIRYEITSKKEKEEVVAIQNKALIKANHELDNFVYRVSHDLRAPITSALGIIELCLMENPSEEIRELLFKQLTSMNKLDKFIQDILNYSRNTRLEVSKTTVDFNYFIEEVINQHNTQYPSVNIKVNVEGQKVLVTDETRLTIIFNNLISNAFKFAALYKDDSFIDIQAQILENNAIIQVSDNGIGIQESHLENIFDMFYRATDTNYGSGLGLYIVKEAVQKIGGEVHVTSKYGEGTTFTIIIPNYEEELSKSSVI